MTQAGMVLGIDAGGSRTRARGVLAGRVVHDGSGGPGNPLTVGESVLRNSLAQALAGCAPPSAVGACVTGVDYPPAAAKFVRVLADFFPRAAVLLVPDYVAAYWAAPAGSDVSVIAGTGSAVVSRVGDPYRTDGYRASGGRGWIVGDHGSAARLGRVVIERFVDNPDGVAPRLARAVEALYGTRDWRELVAGLHVSTAPAAWLARAGPVLTGEAERAVPWAADRLGEEMGELALTTMRHISRYAPGREVQVSLSGGVWASPAARGAFAGTLQRLCPRPVRVQRCSREPIEGAVRFALGLVRDDGRAHPTYRPPERI